MEKQDNKMNTKVAHKEIRTKVGRHAFIKPAIRR